MSRHRALHPEQGTLQGCAPTMSCPSPSSPLTDHLYPPNFVHEQCRDDVAWQHGQAAQEADQVDQKIIVLLKVDVAAFLLLHERAVDEPAVDEFVFVEICEGKRQRLDSAWLESLHTAAAAARN